MPRHASTRLLVALVASALPACFGGPADTPPEPTPPPPRAVAARPAPPKAPPVEQPASAELPDVVLVTLDTTRADHLGLYGYFRDTSPHLDALGAESLVFDRFVVPMATTLPTHTSLMTGVWPTEHGIIANVRHGGQRFVPTDALVPLAQWLGGVGYQTGGFVSAAPLADSTGIARGFQAYTQPPGDQRTGDLTTRDALGWLASARRDVPLLMWVHYYDPHNPFMPPPAYRGLFKDSRVALNTFLDERGIARATKRPTGEPVRAVPSHNLYDGEIRFMDDQLARLLQGLEERGRLDNTLVVVVGDHGEGLNQHGQPGHGLVWDEQLHAPLLIKAPGITPGRVPHVTSAADVLPTALSLVDLPGRDAFLEQVSGANVLAQGFAERPVLSQTSERQEMFGRAMTYTLTGPRWKCSWSAEGDTALYDLQADPFELAPVDDPTQLATCVDALKAELERQKARAVDLDAGRTEDIDADELERLRQLGYLDDDAPAEEAEGGHDDAGSEPSEHDAEEP